jgi:hypothetical protein
MSKNTSETGSEALNVNDDVKIAQPWRKQHFAGVNVARASLSED